MKNKKFYSFRYKLMILCMALTIIPTCLMSTFQYHYSSSLVERQTQDYLRDVVDWTYVKASDFVKEVDDITFSMISNMTIQNILSNLGQTLGRFEKYKMVENLKDQMSSYALLKDYISNVTIVTDDGASYSYNKTRSTSDIDVDQGEVYEKNGSMVWRLTDQDQQELVVARKINSLKSSKSLGYVAVTIKEEAVNELVNAFNKIEGGRIYLLNEGGRIIAAQDKELLGSRLTMQDQEGYTLYTSGGMENGWTIQAAVSTGYFRQNVRNLRNVFYLVAFTAALVVALAAVRLSKSVTKPLVTLSKRMEKFGQGDFGVRCDIETNDEFGMVGDTFNQMVEKIQYLLSEIYEQQLLKQKAEMQSLQMQINPHFLYNTLETINWMARMQGIDEVGEIAASLGNLMRFALAPDTYITLEREVKSLQEYIRIQEYRYGDRLRATVLIPEELYGYSIPKLVVQPILENAIVHGVEDKIGDAQVTVTGEKKEDVLYIRVKDNGIGMPSEIIERIYRSDQSVEKTKGTSIGLRNVNRRLKMHYGEEFGIQINSVMNEGTEVTLKLRSQLYSELTREESKKGELLTKED